MCNITCDDASTNYISATNACSCKTGYSGLTLQGSAYMCNITCDDVSTIYLASNQC